MTESNGEPSVVVLVEGPSDAAVLEVLARRLGLGLGPEVAFVSMGGVTNIRSALASLADGTAVAGLCDGNEERYFVRALQDRWPWVEAREDMERCGFFVCVDDLEDELIRALGAARVVRVVEAEGERQQLETFQNQPAQRDRSVHDQLHRFCGTKSGRKVRLAAALAEELPLDDVPAPLLGVLFFAASLA